MSDIKKPAGDNWIGCAVCLNITGARIPAATIVKGYAVCEAHAKIASQPKFDLASFVHSQERRAV